MARFHDGYRMDSEAGGDTVVRMTKLFYPKSWLESVGYFGPPTGPSAARLRGDGSRLQDDSPFGFAALLSAASYIAVACAGLAGGGALERRRRAPAAAGAPAAADTASPQYGACTSAAVSPRGRGSARLAVALPGLAFGQVAIETLPLRAQEV